MGDELLRDDIAACVSGVPEKRLADPAKLSERLRSIEERRRHRDDEVQAIKGEEESLRRRQRIKKLSLYAGAGIAALVIIIVVQRRPAKKVIPGIGENLGLPKGDSGDQKALGGRELRSGLYPSTKGRKGHSQ